MTPYVYVVAGFVVALYGIVATAIGAYSAAHPCNINTQASVLSCEPGPKLGDVYFHIHYTDYLGALHNATIVSRARGNNGFIFILFPLNVI